MKIFALIPSGGSGSRTSESMPKQYVKFSGKEMIAYTLDVFQNCSSVDEIIIPAQEEYFGLLNEIKLRYNFSKVQKIVKGGKTRQESVFNALKSITAESKDFVIVHDAARPLLTNELLTKSIKEAIIFDNSVVALKARDTLSAGKDYIEKYLNRDETFYLQTPQIFRYNDLMSAFEFAKTDGFQATDESMLVHHYGKKVRITEGSSMNIKITSDDDIRLFKMIAENLVESKSQNL